ncbi:MAG: VCBS repeat-containing protein [Cyclobacteriaceae bacterium]|nr:VCBS repeat-containing protein [Cyclobacteriaceae bacterium SS2]
MSKIFRLPGFILLILSANANLVLSQSSPWTRHTIDASLSGADGVRLADVNGDRYADITTGWEESGYTKVYIHPGFDQVKISVWQSVTVGKTPDVEDAFFFDFDGNGSFDIVSCTEGQEQKIYFNIAPANPGDYLEASKWTTKALPASVDLMRWMYAIPMQVDGKNGIDLVAGGKGINAQIGWFESPEDPKILEDWIWHPISDATWVMSLFARDMDNDGDMDIVTSDRKPGKTNGIRWMENPGKFKKQKQPWKNHFIGAQGVEVMFMDLADLDQDGLEDAIGTEYTNQQIVFFKRLDQSGDKWATYPIPITATTGRAKSVAIGDIDANGKPDIVHSTETNEGDRSGIFWLSHEDTATSSSWKWYNISGPDGIKYDRIELLDMDGDGDLDVLTCEENFGPESEGLGIIWYENPLR